MAIVANLCGAHNRYAIEDNSVVTNNSRVTKVVALDGGAVENASAVTKDNITLDNSVGCYESGIGGVGDCETIWHDVAVAGAGNVRADGAQ